MKIKDLPSLDKPRIYQIDLDNVQDFISLYKDLIKDNRFTILGADSMNKASFIAYYEKDGREYGYGVRISHVKALNFLIEENKDLDDHNKYFNIHHYVGRDNPVRRISEQRLKDVNIAIDKINHLRVNYPELKVYIDDKLLKIIHDNHTEVTKG